MKIQLTKTKTIEWTPPWQKAEVEVSDIVGIELESGHAEGCPAVRLQRRKGETLLVAAGFVPPPATPLPMNWDELGNLAKWSVPSTFRAEHAAIALHSVDSFTRQTAAAPFLENLQAVPEGAAMSKDGQRSVFRQMADESSVLQASLPEYQALWVSRLLADRRRPSVISMQTDTCAMLSALTIQPDFCKNGDELAIFVSESNICLAGYRAGVPLLYRECPGIAGTAAMREAVKRAFGIDEAMVDTVFANNGIIDTRPALEPLLSPVVSQIELSVDYLKNRLGASLARVFVMGDSAGSNALKKIIGERTSLPIHAPSAFDGLVLPSRSTAWTDRFCVGDAPQTFLTALGAALSVLGDTKSGESK